MRDILRLLRYVRPYFGRLLAAAVSSALISLVYLGLLVLIQPILELFFPGASTLTGTGAGKLQPFDTLRKLLGFGASLAPGSSFARWLNEGTTSRIALVAVLIVILFAKRQ